MRLYHCFPRIGDDDFALAVLAAILDVGLLCAFEPLDIGCDPTTERPSKLDSLARNEVVEPVDQSRASFTLLSRDELLRRVDRAGFAGGGEDQKSHMDLFGGLAIGIDPVRARRLGVLPTNYFYRSEIQAGAAGLSVQMVHRLAELRTICGILAFVEAKGGSFASASYGRPADARRVDELRRELSIDFKHEPQVGARLAAMSSREAERVFELFDTDRVAAADLHDFLNMLLSAFQTADSSFRDSPLEFILQREWRLIYHHRAGLEWFCLDPERDHLTSAAGDVTGKRARIRSLVGEGRPASFYRHSWVLCAADGRPFPWYVDEVVVPKRLAKRARGLLVGKGLAQRIPVHTYDSARAPRRG